MHLTHLYLTCLTHLRHLTNKSLLRRLDILLILLINLLIILWIRLIILQIIFIHTLTLHLHPFILHVVGHHHRNILLVEWVHEIYRDILHWLHNLGWLGSLSHLSHLLLGLWWLLLLGFLLIFRFFELVHNSIKKLSWEHIQLWIAKVYQSKWTVSQFILIQTTKWFYMILCIRVDVFH